MTSSQLSTFHEDGFVVIPNALDEPTIHALLDETNRLLSEFSLDDHPMTTFSTGDGRDRQHIGDDYFLTSGDKIRYFLEEGK